MYILHIESSTKICSVALSDQANLLQVIELKEGMNHTAMLAPSIDRLIKDCDIHLFDLKAISVSSGPGSFTGLRVGCSTSKAMAYSLGIPILPVPSLWALAAAAFSKYPQAVKVMPMIDARRMEVYTAVYRKDGTKEIGVASYILDENRIEDLFPGPGSVIICGDGAKKVVLDISSKNLMVDTSIQCSAAHLIEPAYSLYTKGEYADPMHFVPFYLKPPNITKPKDKALA